LLSLIKLEYTTDSETTCYSLINKTAIDFAKKIIKEADGLTEDKQNNEELLKQMMKIYSFKETDKERYRNWNGIAVDHPIVEDFREKMFKTIKEKNLEIQYPNFITEFNVKFQYEIQTVDKFKDCQKQTILKNSSKERSDYLNWLSRELEEPHPVDEKKATGYYIQNRAIEFDLEEEKSYRNRDPWNMSDAEVEDYFKTQIKWTIIDFLSSRETIKFITAPFGTGKTSFSKFTVIKIAESYLSGQDTWIPIYIPLNQRRRSLYSRCYHSSRFKQ
jgi:hypothetical protein